MCGICGIITEKQYPPRIIKSMTNAMIHRGPDDEGYFRDEPLAMGVRRLSIIDIEGGNQPFTGEDGRYTLIFNGEIYNHEELRAELIERGHVFRSRCDAESVLHVLEEYGDDGICKLRGMFAFAIWDSCEKSLLLARDRLGEKPLYYYYHGGVFAFASEIKPLLEVPEIARNLAPDFIAIHQIMTYNFPIGVRTAFKDIQELPPGYLMVWKDGKVRFKQYWEIKLPGETDSFSFDEKRTAEELLERLRYTVRMRLMSDVPVGVFLSGGLDSSIVAACAKSDFQKLNTFSLSFDEPLWDESAKARSTAEFLKTNHIEIRCEPNLSLLPQVLYYLEQPQRWSGTVGLFQLYQTAGKQVKVILSGEGADEIFGGYPHLTEFPLRYSNNVHPLATYLSGLSHLSVEKRKKLFNPDFVKSACMEDGDVDRISLADFFIPPAALNNKAPFNIGLYLDIKCRLVKFVTFMLDRLSMANSVEARAPFLDHELVEYVLTIPASLKVIPPYSKYILRRSALELLPAEILSRPKQGFVEPADKWMRGNLPSCITRSLAAEVVKEKGYFNPDAVSEMFEKHRSGEENYGYDLIGVASVHIWDDLFIIGKPLEEVASEN